ncbi:MAG: hypothetical protein JXA52_01805 [Planctomycetes bacterium]|nr:hypothetical protein [Planctomycetota bacterium]
MIKFSRFSFCFLAAAAWVSLLFTATSGTDEMDYHIRTSERILNGSYVSPRSAGLAGSYAALEQGAHSTYTNPAGLGNLSKPSIFHNLYYEKVGEGNYDTGYTTITIGGAVHINSLRPEYYPRREMGNHGVGVVYSHTYGGADGKYGADYNTNNLAVAYGRSFNYGRVLAGMRLAYQNTHVDEESWNKVDFGKVDFTSGILVRLNRTLTLGGVLTLGAGDADSDLTGYGDGSVSSREIRMGLAQQMSECWLLTGDLAFQEWELKDDEPGFLPKEEHDLVRFSIGSELELRPELLTLRGGIFIVSDDWIGTFQDRRQDRSETYTGLSGGASWKWYECSLEYDANITTNGDFGHYASLLMDF